MKSQELKKTGARLLAEAIIDGLVSIGGHRKPDYEIFESDPWLATITVETQLEDDGEPERFTVTVRSIS